LGIYTSNRYFGEAYDYASEIPMNEAYDAAFGCAHILADCQRNDMAIFESSIYSDMEEVKSIQEGYGYVNENAFTDLIKKIIETFKKLIGKIKGIFAAFIAKITGAFKDGKDLVKKYEKQIIKYSNWKGFKCKKIRVPKSTNVNIKSAVNTLFKYDENGTGIQVNYSFTLGTGSGLNSFNPIPGHNEYNAIKGVKAIDDADAEDLKNAIVENYLEGSICKDLTELHTDVMDHLFDDEDDINDDDVKSGSYFSAAWIKQVLNEGEKWTKDIKKFNDRVEKNINTIIDNLNKDDDNLAKFMSKHPGEVRLKGKSAITKLSYNNDSGNGRISKSSGTDFENNNDIEINTDKKSDAFGTTENIQKIIHALQKLSGNEQEVIAKVTSEYMEVNKFVLAQARKVWTAAAAWSSGVHKESVEYANAMGDVAAEQLYTVMESVGY
jgi:hypothetical protein